MSASSSHNVSLPPELDTFIRERIASGQNTSSNEVIKEGLLLLQSQEREKSEQLAAFRAKIQHSTDQADRGELIGGDEVFAEIDEMLRGYRKVEK